MSKKNREAYTTHEETKKSKGASPWTLETKVHLFLWELTWFVCCRWTPKPFNSWRLLILKSFGATIMGTPFIHQRARIQIPWNLKIGDKASIGDRANLYSLDAIEIGEHSIIAQEAYLCTGSHDFNHPNLPLITARIVIGRDVFIGARAFVMPGVTVGDKSIIGACAVVRRSVDKGTFLIE